MSNAAHPITADSVSHTPETQHQVVWDDPTRARAFARWLSTLQAEHGLQPSSLRLASADASFRRYLRIDAPDGSRVIMDAPPAHENCRPFVDIAALLRQAGLLVPEILAWDEPNGFMLMSDLGEHTMMERIDRDHPQANHAQYMAATDSLLAWQLAGHDGRRRVPPAAASVRGFRQSRSANAPRHRLSRRRTA